MSLKGTTNAEKIWNFFAEKGLTPHGIAGLMGNLYAESGLNPANLQNTYEKKLGKTDAQYTAEVDAGTYTNFVHDSAGYGLAQWTYWSRKEKLLNFVKTRKTSVGDLEAQLCFLWEELAGYSGVLSKLKSAKDIRTASDAVLVSYERPADQSESAKQRRAGYGQTYFDQFGAKQKGGGNVFKERTTKPEAGNKYYITKGAGGWSPAIKGSPTDKDCDVLANCVGYAIGRFNEIGGYGSCKYLRSVNAENFIQYKDASLEVGQTPRVGAVIVWRKGATLSGSDGAGHVAIVERVISATQIVTSESGYGSSSPFWTKTRNKGDGNWGAGSGYTFLGFIYNPAECCKGSEPAKEEAPEPTVSKLAESLKVGDVVDFTGSTHYASAGASTGPACKPGKAKITQIYQLGKSKHPFHLVAVSGGGSTVYGWVNVSDIAGAEKPAAPAAPAKTVDELAKEVIDGKWGNGSDRKQRITAAGYSYEAVQSRVNELCAAKPAAAPWTPKVGDEVIYNGTVHYNSANSTSPKACKGGRAKITQIYQLGKSKHPYHLIKVSGKGATVYGWVDAGSFTKA